MKKIIPTVVVLAITLCTQAFFFPLIFKWYEQKYFDGKAANGTFPMFMIMMFIMIITAVGLVACISKIVERD